MQKLQTGTLSRQEADELRGLIEQDLKRSDQDETIKAIILIGLGMLIGHALAKGR